ncbi:regulatory protein RecX [Clostridium aceticum]|uniref:Regulatory protein RecX n=1 Tax=Clostridium aceticum TaxID=84022 RepID=A0A0D8ICW6_9CLOT|nr:RecX family transcriptional regulator [Clostridium aceticum]AKL95313.1 regulatory protein RecX [Clostridium aceticum]KJF28155.1 hypothetical protein TZ02_06345 [Clostridium aceticum]
MHNNEYKQAFRSSLNYLSYKLRSKSELVSYLSSKGYPSTCIVMVIDKLESLNYLDDKKFAEIFVKNMIEKQKKGRGFVKKELIEKGISDPFITDALALFPLKKEIEIAQKITEKFFLQKKNLPFNQIKMKLYPYLTQKGFTKEAISQSLFYLEEEKFQSIVIAQQDLYQADATDLAKKYYEKYIKKEPNPFKLKQKIYAQLMRRGYNFDLIQCVVEELF